MYTTQKGFTLIELVVVIVLLGILGVTALGKFEDLSTEAAEAATDGVASELSSSSAVNYAASTLGSGGDAIATGSDGCTDGALGVLFAAGTFPAGYTASGSAAGVCNTIGGAGEAFNCTVTYDDDTSITATATVICTGT